VKKVLFAGDRLFMKFPSLSYFENRAGEADAVVVSAERTNDEEFRILAEDASAVVVVARKINRDLIEAMEKCRLIMTLSVGYDCIDVEAATRKGIPVCSCATYCTDEVANHAMTLLLTVSRKIHEIIPQSAEAVWDHKGVKPISNFHGKTLGILGLGKIGRAIVPKAKGFGMNVAAFDPYIADDIFDLVEVERKYEMEEILKEADFITIHTPLTAETRHMIDERALGLMKPNSVIINTARGAVIEENALVKALNQRRIGGAGIDVLEKEPPTKDHPLLACGNALVTPHIAWYSEESYEKNKVLGMDEIVRVLNGKRPRHIVNPEIFGMNGAKSNIQMKEMEVLTGIS